MARDRSERTGGGSELPGPAIRPARRGRPASWVRSACVLLCAALLLQPSAAVVGRGASRLNAPAASRRRGLSLTVVTAHTLLYVAKGVAGGLRSLASAITPGRYTTGGFDALAAGAAASMSASEPAAAIALLGSPVLSVTTTSDSQVSLSWTPVSGAATYRVERTANLLTPYSQIAETASTAYNDAAVSRGNTYLYRVRAVDGNGVQSSPSAVVMATSVTFTDETLVAGSTKVKWQHVADLRTAITGVRRAAALSTANLWQEAVTTGTPIHATQIQEMRDRLNEALAALGLPTPAFTDTTLHAGANGTPIRKVHFDELRSRSRSGSGVTGSGLMAYDFATARLDASNRTGGPGVDLVSRNFNWGIPLVSLPGRSGLDLGLSLSYNSLVWTKSGNYVLFDGDWGTPSPGFRLGFPVVQGKFVDGQAAKAAYMLVTPSGARVSLRQTATAGVYEAGDSSHLQLAENPDGSLTVTTTGGANMTYLIEGGAFKCTKVEDADGNYITASYDAYGNLSTITDTLGRALAFNYDANGYLGSITQVWHREVESGGGTQVVTETHYWARFTYADVAVRTAFTGLTVFGPANNQTFHALAGVQLSDASAYTFGYTTWGQVNKVTTLAPDGRTLNYVSLNLPADDSQPQSDCPRFTESHAWAAYWNGDADGVPAAAEEAVASYTAPAAATWTNPVTQAQEAGSVSTETTPDGTVYKDYWHSSGWDKGVARLEEFWSGGTRMKWVGVTLTQDDEGLAYEQNPRVTRADIFDSDGNHRRTDVAYTTFGLPQDVTEYDSTATSEVRRTHTDYLSSSVNAGGAYLNKRIIGLPAGRNVYGVSGGQETLASKLTYDYDLTGEYLADAGAVAQHDAAIGTGVTTRGNVCRVRRWDVTDPLNQSKTVFAETGYNTLGSAVFARDALGHTTGVSYADSDGGARLAYPTTVTDPDGFTAETWYNYDMGVVFKTQTPLPNVTTNQPGPVVTRFYDSAGRALKVKSEADGGYTRREYAASGLYAKQFTLVDTGLAETFAMTVADGAGRARGTLRDFPGSTGGYAAQRFEYDNLGRRMKAYSPTEVSVNASDLSDVSSWQPAGDDATANGGYGWLYAQTSYDWKGRPLLVTNPGTPATTREFLYGGCGCAGGEVVTTRDEVGRRQKVSYDVLGRVAKTQVLTQQDKSQQFSAGTDTDVYSTVTNTYDALDHVTQVTEQAGVSGASQVTTAGYDGHGRLQTRHTPDQDAGASTAYTYNADDTPNTVTDGRGAVTTYFYENNNRRLVTKVTHALGGTTLTDTFAYDAVGNRTRMDDAQGWQTYSYDPLSRMSSETRYFTALAANSSDPYTLGYTYTLSGQLKTLTDPFGSQFTYGYDQAGQLTAVTGSAYAGVTTYATGGQYRAWGAVKGASFGDQSSETVTYDSRLRPYQFRLLGSDGTPRLREDYAFYDDSRLHQITDLDDTQGTHAPDTLRYMSRTYAYDHLGRVLTAGGTNVPTPYEQTYSYDAFSNLTSRAGTYNWEQGQSDAPTYTNNRRVGWTYDADGRVTYSPSNPSSPARTWGYDAAGQLVGLTDTTGTATVTGTMSHDGDGQLTYSYVNNPQASPAVTSYYLVRSSVLGGEVVTKLDSSGNKDTTYVPAGGLVEAQQTKDYNSQPVVNWAHRDAVGATEQGTQGLAAYDPLGNYVQLQAHPPVPPHPDPYYGPVQGTSSPWGTSWGGADNYSHGCLENGEAAECDKVEKDINNGSADITGDLVGSWTLTSGDLGAFPPGLFTYVHQQGDRAQYAGRNDIFFNTGDDLGEVASTGPLVNPQDQAQQSTTHCKDILNLEAADTEKGALARLIFAESTGLSAMESRLVNVGGDVPDFDTYYLKERFAVAASVYNRVSYLKGITTKRDPLRLGTPGAGVVDVIYSHGDVSGIQYQGFSSSLDNKGNVTYSISQGIQGRINRALNSAIDAPDCYDLYNAVKVADAGYVDPYGNNVTFGLFSGNGSPGAAFYPLDSIPGSGNRFYGLKH